MGRTGTFIALLRLLRQLPAVADEAALDKAVTGTIEAMRDKRLWMVKTDIEFATLYAAVLLRLRNPDTAEFALTWPLKDGARTVSLGSERADPVHARTPAAGTAATAVAHTDGAAAVAVPFSPRTRVGAGFGAAAAALAQASAGGASAAAAAAPTPSPVQDAAMEDACDEGAPPVSSQLPEPPAVLAGAVPPSANRKAAKGGSSGGGAAAKGKAAGGRSVAGGGGSSAFPADAAALRVRTPEDEEEATMEVDTGMARCPTNAMPLGAPPSAMRTPHAGARGGAFPTSADALETERVDNTADVAHYAGVGASVEE